MQILKGHVSPETAYVVDDYPYGLRLRCTIRYWLEYKRVHGVRLVSQTTHPYRDKWNKPKATTYAKFGGAMYLDDEGHVQWSGLTDYSNGAEAKLFEDSFGEGVPEGEARSVLERWVRVKLAYDAGRAVLAMPEAPKAFCEPSK